MVKKVVKKTITETIDDSGNVKTTIQEHPEKIVERKPREKRMTAKEREELLIENFVGLQNAMTNMSIKFGMLSDNIARLLQVFEESAKNLIDGGRPDDKDMLGKINSLLDQNKTIAKGLVLMESKLRGRVESNEAQPEESFKPRPRPLPSI
jgi:hypothetical protein